MGYVLHVRDDKTTFRQMVTGFVILCICCGIMHVIMVKKGNLYLERSEPRYNLEVKDVEGTMREGVGSVEGEVSAVSYDQFFLTLPNQKIQAFLQGDLETPEVGTLITVTYAGGEPPKALMIESNKKK